MAMTIKKVRLTTSSAEPTQNLKPQTVAAVSAFRVKDMGFFDLDSNSPPVEIKDTHQIYHNIYSFTQHLRVKTDTMDISILRNLIDQCLLEKADTWYTQELAGYLKK